MKYINLFSALFLGVLIFSFSSCISAFVYRAANGEAINNYSIVSIDSILLTDSNEVLVHLKTQRGNRDTISRIAVVSPKIPSKYTFNYSGKKVYKTSVEGEVIKKIEVIGYPNLPKIDYRYDFDSIWYQMKLDSLEQHPDGYVMVSSVPSYSSSVAYMYMSDTGIITNDLALYPQMRLTKPHYLALLPMTAAFDVAGIAAIVAIGIPVAIGWGVYELFDSKK